MAYPVGSTFPPVQYLKLGNCLRALVPKIGTRVTEAEDLLNREVASAQEKMKRTVCVGGCTVCKGGCTSMCVDITKLSDCMPILLLIN